MELNKIEAKNIVKYIELNKNIVKYIAAIIDENTKAKKENGKFQSTHEALGVIREEYKEFENEIFMNNTQAACKEAVQLASSALQFIIDFKQPFDLQSCLDCKFARECFGPRENGCRRFPEKSPNINIIPCEIQ